jgi:hypothetical protein
MKLRELFEGQAEDFAIANVLRRGGAIGTQGVTEKQVAGVLKNVCKLDVSEDMTMRELVDAFRHSKEAQQLLIDFMHEHPVKVSKLPDDTYHLEDGHHRTFLMHHAGHKTVPAVVSH